MLRIQDLTNRADFKIYEILDKIDSTKKSKYDIFQGSQGMGQLAINWCTSPMMVDNICHSVD